MISFLLNLEIDVASDDIEPILTACNIDLEAGQKTISYPVFNVALDLPCIIYVAIDRKDRLRQTG